MSAAAILNNAADGTPPADTKATPPADTKATPGAWYGTIADAELATWAHNKQFPDAATALKSYHALEKHVGTPAERLVKLPAADEPIEAWAPVFDRLGRPAKPDGYTVPEEFKADPVVAKFREVAHKSGFTDKQFTGALAWYKDLAKEGQAEADTKFAQQSETDLATLRGTLGGKFDSTIKAGQAAMRKYGAAAGLDAADLDKIERAIGTGKLIKLFGAAGAGLLEAEFKDGEGGGAGGPMSIAEASQAYTAFIRDKSKVDAVKRHEQGKAQAGDAEIVAEFNRIKAYKAGFASVDEYLATAGAKA